MFIDTNRLKEWVDQADVRATTAICDRGEGSSFSAHEVRQLARLQFRLQRNTEAIEKVEVLAMIHQDLEEKRAREEADNAKKD